MDPKKERQVVGQISKTLQELNDGTFQTLTEKLQEDSKSKLHGIMNLHHSIYSAQAKKLLDRINKLPKTEAPVPLHEQPSVVVCDQVFAVDQHVELLEEESCIPAGSRGLVKQIHLLSVQVSFYDGTEEYIKKDNLKILPSNNSEQLSKPSIAATSPAVSVSPSSSPSPKFEPYQRVKTIEDFDDKHQHIPANTEGTIDSVFSGGLLVQFDGFGHPTVLPKKTVVIISEEVSIPRTEQPITHVVHQYPAPVLPPAPSKHALVTGVRQVSNQDLIVEKLIHSERQGVEKMGRPEDTKKEKGKKGTKDITRKGSDVILDTLQTVLEQLTTGEYWLLTSAKQKKVIDQLNQIKMGGNQEFKETAIMLLSDIQKRFVVAETLQSDQLVTLHVAFDGKSVGATGTVISIISGKAHVRFAGDKKMTVVSKFLLDPVNTQDKMQESASDTEKPVVLSSSDTETSSASNTPVATVDSAIVDDQVVTEPVADQQPVVSANEDNSSGVLEMIKTLPLISPAESKAEIMVVPQPVEERFPITDPKFFTEGRIFAMQEGLVDPFYDLYYVLKAVDYPAGHRVAMKCLILRPNTADNAERVLDFPYPKRWFSHTQPRFFYPTQQEYVMLFSQHPFGHILPLTLKQFVDIDEHYRQWLHGAMVSAMETSPSWTSDVDVVLSMAELMKHYFLDRRMFSVFIQKVLEDCQTEKFVDYVLGRILLRLKNEEGSELILEDVEQAAWEAKQRIHKANIAESLRNLPFPTLNQSQFSELEAVLQKIESINTA